MENGFITGTTDRIIESGLTGPFADTLLKAFTDVSAKTESVLATTGGFPVPVPPAILLRELHVKRKNNRKGTVVVVL